MTGRHLHTSKANTAGGHARWLKRILLYGSRAKGTHRPGSDIDICLVAPTLALPDLLRLDMEIDELLLPWKIDLSLWHQIDNPALLDHVRRAGIDLGAGR
jgi:predicted nucleotidyltransferase